MIIENKKIAIIGGGPGGLTLARLLQMKHADVTVYERDKNAGIRQQGATLDLHEESGLEALKRAELMDEFKAHYRSGAGKIRVVDSNGAIMLDDHADGKHDESRPEIDRAPLRDILVASLKPDTIVWDSQFASMEKQGEGWVLTFKNGTEAYADIVIAADGANSKLRFYITDIKPIYSGITIVEGNVYHAEKNAPKLWELVKGGKVFALGNEQSLILSAKGEGSLSFYTGCKVREQWVAESGIDFSDSTQVYAWFKDAFGEWSDTWQELFASKEMWFVPRPQYHYPLTQHWDALPNLTMIGDAAHRMPPYAGEGVNMAMQDAYELAECLTTKGFVDIQAAIAHYEERMLARVSAVTEDTLINTEMMHADDGLERLLNLFNGMTEEC